MLRALLADAEKGLVVGLLAAAHYGGEDFHLVGTGSVCEQPTLGISAARQLISRLV